MDRVDTAFALDVELDADVLCDGSEVRDFQARRDRLLQMLERRELLRYDEHVVNVIDDEDGRYRVGSACRAEIACELAMLQGLEVVIEFRASGAPRLLDSVDRCDNAPDTAGAVIELRELPHVYFFLQGAVEIGGDDVELMDMELV